MPPQVPVILGQRGEMAELYVDRLVRRAQQCSYVTHRLDRIALSAEIDQMGPLGGAPERQVDSIKQKFRQAPATPVGEPWPHQQHIGVLPRQFSRRSPNSVAL